MRRQIRNLGVFLMLCYVALFAQLNNVAIFQADELQNKPGNNRAIVRDFDSPRGTVVTADGVLVAQTVAAEPGSKFERQREYPERELFAHITGYYSLQLGAAGVERSYNDELAGRTLDFDLRNLADLFVDRDRVGDLTLSLRADVQRVAREQLGEREGSVVALDPRNGEILGLWSFPSYDPNLLADHDSDAAKAVAELLDASEDKPRLARSYQETFAPGSTFKIVTAAAGVESGNVDRNSPDYPQDESYLAGRGKPLPNFGGATCGGTLFTILARSCNTSFAQIGVEDAGAEQMIRTAEAFGFNQDVPFDLPRPAESHFPTDYENSEQLLAYASVGQYEVTATPLQMALVGAAVANDGRVMVPHVVREVRDDQGKVVDSFKDEVWTTPMSPANADLLRQAMVGVVTEGTASGLAAGLDSYVVGGKTGTAQLGTDPPRSHAWIIGFAGPPDEAPHVAVAVIVEGQPGASEQTGGKVAAPIAAAVLQTALEPPAPGGEQAGDNGSG